MSVHRVVITGLGIVSPLGVGVDVNWRRLLDNYSGVRSLDEPEYAGIPCRVAARVPMATDDAKPDGSLNFSRYFTRMSELKSMPLASAYALVAAHEAIEHSQVRAKKKKTWLVSFLSAVTRSTSGSNTDRCVGGQWHRWSNEHVHHAGANEKQGTVSRHESVLCHSDLAEFIRWTCVDSTSTARTESLQ